MSKKIVQHLHKNYNKHSKDHLREALLALGYTNKEITEAMREVEKQKRHHEIFGSHHHPLGDLAEHVRKGDEHLFLILGVIFGLSFWAVFFAVIIMINQ